MTDYIVDIDGVLALIPEGGRDPQDVESSWEDIPSKPVIDIVSALLDAGHRVVFVTSRYEKHRALTEFWLAWCVPGSTGLPLLMRADGDLRSADVIKREMHEKLKADGFEAAAAFEDLPYIAEMWVEEGLTCLQVMISGYQ